MNLALRRPLAGACLSLCAGVAAHAQVNVTTYHYDLARSGANTAETVLTPANVNSAQFGKLFTTIVDGVVYAQPLYLAGVGIAGGTHNVVYVATEHDSVYAIDADSGAIEWQVSLIAPGGRTVDTATDIDSGCTDTVPEVGITGTPVIDPATGTLYVVAKSYVGGTGVQYLHALDVTSGAEKLGGPTLITAKVPGGGYDSKGGVETFNPLFEHQRAALLLENGHVVIGWGSHCDIDPWHGWVMSYGAGTLAQEAVFATTPNGQNGGVWMAGGGLAADAGGYIYFSTGNGTWNGSTDFGDSIVKLAPPAGGAFAVADYFTPYNQVSLDDNDLDVASGGLVLLPPSSSGAQLLAQQGKQGTIYLLNRNNLGKYCVKQSPACSGSDPQIAQEIPNASGGVWGSPAYWNGNLYWTGANEPISAYSFDAGGSGLISTKPTSKSAKVFPFSAPTPTVSANGTINGILWALDGSGDDSTCDGGADCLGLYAYDATNLSKLLYASTQAANNRDAPGAATKFETPVVANGKVYVGTQYAVSAYGELAGIRVPPNAVILNSADSVVGIATVGAAVPGGGLDGHGDAYAAGLLGSSISWGGSTFEVGGAGVADAVTSTTIPLPAGNDSAITLLASGVNGNQVNQTFVVTYTDGTSTAFTQSLSDWYSPQGYPGESTALSMPYRLTASGAQDNRPFHLYGYAFAVNAAKTVKSLTLPTNRNVVVLAVDVTPAGATPAAASPTFTPAPGSFSGAQSVTLADPTPGAVIHYTLDGSTPTASSPVYGGALSVSATTTLEALATASGYTASAVTTGTYTITGSGGGSPPAGPVAVNLGAAASITAIGVKGTAVANGGLDGSGDAYASALIGASITWAGATFTFGAADGPDAASGATVTLAAGSYSTLHVLATGFDGAQANQAFVVTYTDGTTSRFTQSLSDWYAPQHYAGESTVLAMPYRLTASGAPDNRVFNLYGYSFALNAAKTAKSLTLPANRHVVVLAVDVAP